MTPEVGVIVPCRDAAAFVGPTVADVFTLAADAGVAIEIVVVDDGSTDGTRRIVEDLPVRLVAEAPAGVAAARNAGLADTRAPFIGMLDVDDRWTPAVFDELLPALRDGAAPPIVQGRICDHWPGDGLGPPYEGLNLGSALFAAEVFTTVGPFDETLPRLEDYEWFVRAYDLQVPKCRLPAPVLHYRRRPDGLTGSAPSPDPLVVRVHRDIARRRRARDLPRDPGFASAAEYLGVVPPESERRPRPPVALAAPAALRRLDDRPINPASSPSAVAAFACVRNEGRRLPAMLEHHRRLGIDTFFVVDNGSTDGSIDFLLAQPDVHLWTAAGSFADAQYGTDWLLELMAEHRADDWRLVIDADELFVYLGYEHTAIGDLCRGLDAEGADALVAVMVDVYSDRPVAETRYEAGDDPLAVCGWFDRQPWAVTREEFSGHRSHRSFFGGVRQRVFGAPAGVDADTYFTLNKVPLFRGGGAAQPSPSFHWLDGARVSCGRAALLHWKYTAGFAAEVRGEATRAEHWDAASQYRRYVAGLEGAPGLSLYDPVRSVRFVDSEQLGRLGILAAAGVDDDRSS